MESTKIALVLDYVDPTVDRFILAPLRESICPFDVVKITGSLASYPIWISPIKVGMGQFMYELTLKSTTFSPEQIQSFLTSIAPPLSLDKGNRVRQILGNYSIVINTTNENDEDWPNLESVLKLVATLI